MRKAQPVKIKTTTSRQLLSSYDYCDTMPLIGWAWEFGRRSDEYQKYWDEYQTILKNSEQTGHPEPLLTYIAEKGPFQVHYLDCIDPSIRWSKDMEAPALFSCGIAPASSVMTFNMAYKNRYDEEFPEPFQGESDLLSDGDLHVEASAPDDCDLEFHGQRKKADIVLSEDHPLDIAETQLGNPQVIMALIDISSPCSIDELVEPVRKALIDWRRALGINKRKAKKQRLPSDPTVTHSTWKQYLFIFDTKHRLRKSFAEIARRLAKVDDVWSDPSNIKHHYDKAALFINGGYKDLVR